MHAVKIKALLNEEGSEDLVAERISYFRSTFLSLVNLALEKKDSTASKRVPPVSTVTPTSNPQKRRAESAESSKSKKARPALSPLPSLSKSSPERLTVSPQSQHSQISVSAKSDTSVKSADEDYTKLLLLDFARESRICLGLRFHTPRWREITARLTVWYNTLIIFYS